MHGNAIFNTGIDRYVLGIYAVVVVIPPDDHVAGLKAVSIYDAEPFFALDAFRAVCLKVREVVFRRGDIPLFVDTVSKARLDPCKAGPVESVSVGIAAARIRQGPAAV